MALDGLALHDNINTMGRRFAGSTRSWPGFPGVSMVVFSELASFGPLPGHAQPMLRHFPKSSQALSCFSLVQLIPIPHQRNPAGIGGAVAESEVRRAAGMAVAEEENAGGWGVQADGLDAVTIPVSH